MEEPEEEDDDLLTEIEVEQAPPVNPIPAPEPPVKRKRGRPPKNKTGGKCCSYDKLNSNVIL